jgi:hypothetical protein
MAEVLVVLLVILLVIAAAGFVGSSALWRDPTRHKSAETSGHRRAG